MPDICGAKTRHNGEPCQRAPLANGKCYLHGGKTPAGPLHPRYKHGRYSRYAPAKLLERYEESLQRDDLLNLDDNIALIDARISELLENYEIGVSSETWRELGKIWKDFMSAVRKGDSKKQTELLPEVNELILKGAATEKTWQDLDHAVERRRKLVESEAKRQSASQAAIPIEQVIVLLNAIVSAVKEATFRYADEETAKRIIVDTSKQYRRLIDLEPIERNSDEPS